VLRRFLFIAASLSAGACRKPATTTTTAALPTGAASSSTTSCSEGETRCLPDGNAEVCGANAWQSRACAEGPCVAGGCVSLKDGELALTRAQLMTPTANGWVNAWASYGPIADKTLEDLVASKTGAFTGEAKERASQCSPDGYVSVHSPVGMRAGIRNHLFTGIAAVGAARQAVLRFSAQGRVRVWLRGALVADRNAPSGERPFADELLVPVELAAGLNPVAVAVTQSEPTATGFWLRFGEPDGSLLDYRWAPSHDQSCSLAELTRVDLTARLAERGFAPELTLRLDGLALDSELQLPVKLLLPAPKQPPATKPAADTVLIDKSFARDELIRGAAAAAKLTSTTTKPTVFTVHAEIGNAPRRSWQLQHRGELTDRIAKLAARYLDGNAAKLPASLPEDSAASFEHSLRTIVEAAEASHRDTSWLDKRTKELEELARAIDDGKDPYLGRTGIIYRAYRSPLDGQLQPYITFVSPRLKTAKTGLPLIIVYHGLYNEPSLALRILVGAGPKETEDHRFAARHMPFFPDYGAILVAPGGYRDPGHRAVGEEDVLEVIRRLKKLYPIDDRKISLTGYSLGGTVSFALPLHYPTLFSAAAPLCGYPNLMSYWEISRTAKQPFEEAMLAKRYLYNYVENGKHIPLHIVHGMKDGPHRSAVIADRYRALGYPRIFDIETDLGHNVWDEAYEDGKMVAWLRLHRRPERPDHVRLKTGELRYDRAHWLRLIAFESQEKLAYLDARYLPKQNRFEVKTEGASAFAIDTTGFEAKEAVIDGKSVALDATKGERWFVRRAGGFDLSSTEPDRKGKKRPGVAGPLDDVLRHPAIIVYGTQIPAELEANRLTAEHWSSYDHWAGARFPIRADRDVKEDDLRGRSIVLVGNPKNNSLTARFAKDLPVTFEDDALVFRGQRHQGLAVGISMIRPRPDDPDQYLVLHAGVAYAGTLASRHLPRMTPDFAVYDDRLRAARGGELLGERKVLTAGFFGDDWQ
jgi:predicted esterase